MFELTPRDKEALDNFLTDLVRIPSFSTQEGALAERLAAEMRRVGFAQVYTDRIGNVVGRAGVGGACRRQPRAGSDARHRHPTTGAASG